MTFIHLLLSLVFLLSGLWFVRIYIARQRLKPFIGIIRAVDGEGGRLMTIEPARKHFPPYEFKRPIFYKCHVGDRVYCKWNGSSMDSILIDQGNIFLKLGALFVASSAVTLLTTFL